MKGDPLFWALAFGWGLFLGVFYFLGLWWTLRRLPRMTRPRLWLAAGYTVRTVCLLAGFWAVLQRDVAGFLATLCGFFLMRYVTVRKLGLEKSGGNRARLSG